MKLPVKSQKYENNISDAFRLCFSSYKEEFQVGKFLIGNKMLKGHSFAVNGPFGIIATIELFVVDKEVPSKMCFNFSKLTALPKHQDLFFPASSSISHACTE